MMGGLINSSTVKGDLWMIEAGGNMACYPLATTAEGPGPRVGHASLLVGNAFIVYGGDTKIDESDILDETLYLLNTCEWPPSSSDPWRPRANAPRKSYSPVVSRSPGRASTSRPLRSFPEHPGLKDIHLRWPGRE